jgi:hypothetical protein
VSYFVFQASATKEGTTPAPAPADDIEEEVELDTLSLVNIDMQPGPEGDERVV